MLSLQHLLCIVSEGPVAAPALQQAMSLAAMLDATLDVGRTDDVSPTTLQRAVDTARTLVGEPIRTGWVGAFDSPPTADAIQEYVSTADVDLVVTAAPSGPHSEQVSYPPPLSSLIERLACSLFVVTPSAPPSSLQRLLVPTDFSAHAQIAFEYAVRLASVSDGSIELLHVIEQTPYVALKPVDRLSLGSSSVPEYRARRRLETLLADEPDRDVPITTHLKYGSPTDQIATFVEEQDIDLTVMPAATPPGPVSAPLLREAPPPFLLVRPA